MNIDEIRKRCEAATDAVAKEHIRVIMHNYGYSPGAEKIYREYIQPCRQDRRDLLAHIDKLQAGEDCKRIKELEDTLRLTIIALTDPEGQWDGTIEMLKEILGDD